MAQLADCRLSRAGFVPWPVPHRPAARRRVAEHRRVPGRARRARGERWGTVTQHPRNDDQARSPLVPVLTPLRVTPPRRTPHPHDTIRTRVRLAKATAAAPSGRSPFGMLSFSENPEHG